MNIFDNGKPVEILLVEDNPGDVRLTLESFQEAKVCNKVHTVCDGVEAMAFLSQEGKYAQSPCPDIILLDLNLPKKDGREVLAEIKCDENMKRIPVVVLTTSKSEEDIIKIYNCRQAVISQSLLTWTTFCSKVKPEEGKKVSAAEWAKAAGATVGTILGT